MGTTLTGTTPQDTYDSLIKVTDNGPLSGSLKVLTDGLGNDSALALSTGAASITGTLAVSGDVSIADKIVHTGDTNTAIRFPAADTINFETSGAERVSIKSGGSINFSGTDALNEYYFGFNRPTATNLLVNGTNNNKIRIQNAESDIVVLNSNGNSYFNGGNVGIGTSNPLQKLEVVGSYVRLGASVTDNSNAGAYFQVKNGATIVGQSSQFVANNGDWVLYTGTTSETEKIRVLAGGGLTFNGDTAAANALDDYEEGTWTMGISFGGASVGVTYSANTGTYTKIGRQVTVNGLLTLTSKGSSTGTANVTGLPFTIANAGQNYSSASMRLYEITFANQFQAYGAIGQTVIAIDQITEAGVVTPLTNSDFTNNSIVVVSLTYFV